ncbi:MAG: CxxxxCH/CxxCH domain-containing protein [Nitrospiraceae bacterium]|nr:MAG: CxxxxCH/CxxCH domain-containing protein [Nitrospiraceae bacterium]
MKRKVLLLISVTLLVIAGMLWQCSNPNPDASPLSAAGKHPDNWIVEHRAFFLGRPDACFQCHGRDLLGGISRVSCFSSQFNGQACHTEGFSGHPAGWRDPALHGADAKSQPGARSGFQSCQPCHGTDFNGGFFGVSCLAGSRVTGPCHATDGVPSGAPHSPVPWRTYPSSTHTDTVDDAAGLNAAACALCHTQGANLRTPVITTYNTGKPSCFNSTLCHGLVGHPADWAQPVNHGSTAKSNLTYCQQCHADNASGGPGSNPRFNVQLGRLVDATLGATGCEVCHAPLAAHPPVNQIPAVFGAITPLNPLGTPWYLHCRVSPSGFDACTLCHGTNLDGVGGAAGATACTFCHRSGLPTTLLNCTSCHGNPPDGTVYPNIAFAHPGHIDLNVSDICGECHNGLGSVTLDHFLRARNNTAGVQTGAVLFGAFTQTGGVSPAYNESTLQCTNTYCHGATLAGGANKSPIWSQTNYLSAGCGTCHGFPPGTGAHAGFTSGTVCKNCHTHVNAANTGFDDPTKHVNGAIDVESGAPHVFPYPGATHLSAAGTSPFLNCVTGGCHTNGSTIGVYPVTAGTPPDCRGCHTKLSPGNSCWSCHGTAANGGQPNGSAFPDVAGEHSKHSGFASCSVCHGSNGTGSSNHGPSNRTAHADADVDIQFTGEATGIVFTRSGLNNGHGTCTGTCHGETHNNRTW